MYGKEIIEFGIDRIKYFVGNNYKEKDIIMNSIINCFDNIGCSEYSIDSNKTTYIFFNEDIISISDFSFFYVRKRFDICCETKLASKSIFMRFLDSVCGDIEYNEEFQTAQIVLSSLYDYIEEEANESLGMNLFSLNSQFNKKDIFRMINLELIKDDMQINNYDISSIESIKLQLLMINKIVANTKKRTIVLLEIDCLYKDIEDILTKMNSNMYILVIVKDFECKIAYDKDIFLIDKKYNKIDLTNDNEIYELTLDSESIYSIIDMRTAIFDYLNSKYINSSI